ncbi:hypothetical protein JOQ06_000509, partial [Pogonophryne albipinna]
MSCCLSKRFSVKAIHRLLHQAPSPCQRLRHRDPRCQEPACPLASAEQMSLNCPPPPQTPPPPPPFTTPHRQPWRWRAKRTTPPT